jgi:hypothetical protein
MVYIVATKAFGQERYLQRTVWVLSRRRADRFATPEEARIAVHSTDQSNPTAARAAYLIPIDEPHEDKKA